uniref:Uncharacterized protein n=1 Tax=Sphenodon punctatus TaxID=8508 RepID=A0A8D0G9R8_SPHPU
VYYALYVIYIHSHSVPQSFLCCCRKHEWEKHGTCAATVEPLNSQKKYFGKTLELYEKLDLNSSHLSLTSVYGVTPKIQCLSPEEGEEVQTIGQIEFCLTKELTLRNCTDSNDSSYSGQKDLHFRTEELSVCNDTLTYYPAEVQFHK